MSIRAGRQHDRLGGHIGRIALILSLVVAVFAAAMPAHAAPTFPPLTGRVTDAANILPAATVAALDARLKTLEDTTSTQLVVATVPDLQGYEIDEYGYQLGRAWGIGQKGKNNGAVLIVAPNERKVRIEVGYGLEGVLTDAITSQIIRRNIIPLFKAGDMAGGVDAGADALIKLLALPPGERDKVVQAAAASQSGGGGGPGAGTIVWLIIIVIWVALAVSRRKRGLSAGPTIVWGPGLGGWGDDDRGGGGWGGGGGGWGGGGGGFGGGGGGFGGGGSSGGW